MVFPPAARFIRPMFLTKLRQILWPAGLAPRAARVVLGLLLVACLVNLAESPRPWKHGIAPRLAAGKKPTVKHYVATYNYYMAAANAVLLVGLLGTSPWWLRPTVPQPGTPPGARPDAFSWAVLAFSAAALCYWAGPRLDHSLWGDEEYTFRRNFFGEYRRAEPLNPDSPLKLERVSWLDTVYGYKEPNNHIFQSILSRLCHDFWVKHVWKDCDVQVGEVALRLPPFAAGLLTLPALLALGAALGSPRAGAFAGLLLAFHPWFQRYASEARGYSVVMLLTVMGVLTLILGLRTGKWRWWILYGLAQFLMLWTYITAAFVPLALNAFALGWLAWGWFREGRRGWALSNGARLLVCNLLSAMAFLQMMLPCIPMLRDYLAKGEGVPERMDLPWFLDVLGYFIGGMDGVRHWSGDHYYSWETLARLHPVLVWTGLILTCSLAVLGFALLAARNSGTARLTAVWILLPLGLALLHGQVSGSYYYAWYLIFALPCFALAWGLGADQLGTWLAARPIWKNTPPSAPLVSTIVAVLALGTLAPHLWGQLTFQRASPVEPLRDSVDLIRKLPACYPYDKDTKTVTAMFLMPTAAYDPAGIKINTLEELRALEDYALKHNRILAVHYGAADLAQAKFPEIMAEMDGPGKFPTKITLEATWPLLTRHIELFNNPNDGSRQAPPSVP